MTRYHYRGSVDTRRRGHELTIGAGYLEALQVSAFGAETVLGMVEPHAQPTGFGRRLAEQGAGELNFFAISNRARGEMVAVKGLSELRRNDLIYIPGHVMICTGQGEVIHASGGDMAVRHDNFAALLEGWSYGFTDLSVRRPG